MSGLAESPWSEAPPVLVQDQATEIVCPQPECRLVRNRFLAECPNCLGPSVYARGKR